MPIRMTARNRNRRTTQHNKKRENYDDISSDDENPGFERM